MRRRVIGACVLAGLLMTTGAAVAQLPGGVQVPGVGSLPLSKDALLKQANEMLAELTSMKSSGKLAPEQTKQADALMAKTKSLTSEVEKPQVDGAKLPQLASDLGDLQKQLTTLKAAVK